MAEGLIIEWSPSITDTTGTFAEGVIVDHTPFTIVANYAEARLCTMKSVVLMKNLLIFSP